MNWLKDSLLDILFLGVILSTLFYPSNISFIIIWVYTVLLITSKLLALFMPSLQKRASKTRTPNWVYHTIYAFSLGALIFVGKWYLAATWAIIWGLSIVLLSKQTKNTKS